MLRQSANSSDVSRKVFVVFLLSMVLRVVLENMRIIRLGRVAVKLVSVEGGVLWIERIGVSHGSEGVFDGVGLRSWNVADKVDVAKMPTIFERRMHRVRRYPSRLRSVDVLSMKRKEWSLVWFERFFWHGSYHVVLNGHAVDGVYGSEWIGGSFGFESEIVDVLDVVEVDWGRAASDEFVSRFPSRLGSFYVRAVVSFALFERKHRTRLRSFDIFHVVCVANEFRNVARSRLAARKRVDRIERIDHARRFEQTSFRFRSFDNGHLLLSFFVQNTRRSPFNIRRAVQIRSSVRVSKIPQLWSSSFDLVFRNRALAIHSPMIWNRRRTSRTQRHGAIRRRRIHPLVRNISFAKERRVK